MYAALGLCHHGTLLERGVPPRNGGAAATGAENLA